MFTTEEETSLMNLAEGAAIEMFDQELIKALKNIEDPNRDGKLEREVTLVVKLKPTDVRGVLSVKIGVKSKLGARNVVSTHLSFGTDRLTGQMEIREIQQQRPLFPETDAGVRRKGDKDSLN